ncbi:MAG: SusE domain-containing protein, partial [Flammeovirgaceae bacterium]
MRNIIKIAAALSLAVLVNACLKEETTPQFTSGTSTFSFTPSATSVTVAAKDSLTAALTLTWTDPKFSVGLAKSKFTVMVGPADKGFANFQSKEFVGVLTGSLLGKELNRIALRFGGVIGQPISLDVKMIASLTNNNEPISTESTKITFTPASDLSLAASSGSVVTTAANKDLVGVALNWSIGFNGYEGSRSYQLQYARGGTNFASPVVIDLTAVNRSFTQKQLNDIAALAFGIPAGTAVPVEFRVRASNGLGAVILSNVVTVSVTPYETVYPSIWGMGAALNGWGPWDNPDKAVEVVGTAFQVYEMVAQLKQGEIFRFFAQYDWNPTSYNYNYFTTVSSVFELNPADGANNFKVVGATGWYRVTVNLNTKVVTAIPATEPTLYMMGLALNGWGPWNDKEVKMIYKRPGVFEATATFKVEAFRFFEQNNWSPKDY